jgi:glycosyltransferase involved in cell wall biosynthesis
MSTPTEGRDGLRLLVVSPSLPRPAIASGDRRLFAILEILARRHSVDLLTVLPPWEDDPVDGPGSTREAYRQIGVRVLEGPSGAPLPIARASYLQRYDAAIFEFWTCASWASEIFRTRQPWAKVIVDTVDVHFLREGSGVAVGAADPAEVEANKQAELAVYRRADAVIAITTEDRDALESAGGMPPLDLIPNLLVGRPRDDRPRAREALFVGGFKHAPNIDGIVWFAREVWPRVRAEVPDARLTVVGSYPTPEVLALGQVDGIEVVGQVPDTGPYLDRAAVSVAPLRFGAGMKGKVGEAMVSGLAVVTTTIGAQGLGATSGEHLIVADDPEAFASGLVGLLLDPSRAERIGRAGRALAESLCSPGSAGARLEEILGRVVGRGRPALASPKWLGRSALEAARDLALPAGRSRNVLVVTVYLPRPDRASGDRRLFEMLALLARRHSVDLYCEDWSGQESTTPEEDRAFVQSYREIGVRLINGRDRPLTRLLLGRAYDSCVIEFWNVAEWAIGPILQIQPWLKIVVDTVDVHYLREEAAAKLGLLDAAEVEANKRRELATYRRADALMVVTPEDRDALGLCAPIPRRALIPNIMPLRPREVRSRDRELLFVGGFRHAPNADGIAWFVNEAWPSIRSACPDAKLTVVGSGPPPEVQNLERFDGVEVVGYVPRTEPYLDRAAVSIAPLRFGGGMKGKVNEAMGSGLPVVTTSFGAQGLGAVPGRDLIVADDAGSFARGVIELLQDPARAESMGRSGQELVRSLCSPEVVGPRLDGLIAELAGRSGRARRPPGALWSAKDLARRAARPLADALKNRGARQRAEAR